MNEWKGSNRRKSPRIKYPCLIVLQDKEFKDKAVMVQTDNISIGGIAVVSKRDIKMLSLVDVDLDLGLEDHLCFVGKVVWKIQRTEDSDIKPLFYDIGISFLEINKKDLKRVERIVFRLKDKKDREEFFIIQSACQ